MGQAADRTLMVLDMVVSQEQPVSLMELVERTGLDKSVMSRLLQSLETSGFVARDPRTRTYTVGPRFMALSIATVRRSGLGGVGRERLRALRDDTGETVSVHLRVGDARICVDGYESPHPMRRALALGESVPIFEGPTGKAIMAFLPDEALARAMAGAERAGRDLVRLRGQLASLRRRHYLVVTSDRTAGVGAVSAPLFDRSGVVGSVTIAGPEDRWSVPRMEATVPAVLQAAVAISAALGGDHPAAGPEAARFAETARS